MRSMVVRLDDSIKAPSSQMAGFAKLDTVGWEGLLSIAPVAGGGWVTAPGSKETLWG